ncbi:MAG TPA: nucleotidyltransferase [Syntrophomonas sp.]|nr:nucleotidyltransferase [Syntrophomonas sp.]
MTAVGIIAEFNPFHNGHLHLLREAKKAVAGAPAVCVMSGNFLQRGEAAWCDKWSRTAMALRAGADLVIELPVCYAVRSAYYFARGAVQLLERTGVVTHLAFGSENGDLDKLKIIAAVIGGESQDYRNQLKEYLARGYSFARARSLALQQIIDDPDLSELLLQPNNILALEYLHVLDELQSPMAALTFPRLGTGYHSNHLSELASASAIRSALTKELDLDAIAASVPPATMQIIAEEIFRGRAPVVNEALEQSILLKLRLSSATELADIYEVGEGLEHRIVKAAQQSVSLAELKHKIKTKRYSLSRINRMLLYCLWDLSKNKIACFDEYGPQYLHVLGFSPSGQKILQEIKSQSILPFFSRGSEVKQACRDHGRPALQTMLELDQRVCDIYSLLYPNPEARKGGRDFIMSPIRT